MTEKKTPDTLNKLIDAMMELAAAKPFGEVSFASIAETAQCTLSDSFAVARNRGALIDAYIERIDRAMIDEDYGFTDEMSVRDKLFDLAMTRFEAMQPHRLAVASILNADGLTRLSQFTRAGKRTSALMLEMAGVASDGLTGQGRVAVFATAIARVGQTFLKDDSDDLSATMRALDKSLTNLEQWAVDMDEMKRGNPGGSGRFSSFKGFGKFTDVAFGGRAWKHNSATDANS